MLKFLKLNSQNILIGLLLTGIFYLGFFISYTVLGHTTNKNPVAIPTPNIFVESTPAPINEVNKKEEGVYNFLFLGHGGGGHSGGGLTDSIMVFHIDTAKHQTALISIPRDLWIPGNHKINYAGVPNGFKDMGGVIQNVTGLPINYFIAVDFGGFVKLIDSFGKIKVDVPKTFDDAFYPVKGLENESCGFTAEQINEFKTKYSGFELEKQFTCRYEHIHYDKGEAELTGESALKFARSRHGDSDFGRSERQFAILVGVKNKLLSFTTEEKVSEIIDQLLKIVKTDLNPGVIKTLIQVIGDPAPYTVKQIQLTTDNVLNNSKSGDGQYILIPKSGNFNYSGIQDFIENNI